MAVQISKNPTIYTPSNNVPTQTSSVPTASITASNSAANTTKETLTYEAKAPDTSNASGSSSSGNTVNNSNLPKWDKYENGLYYRNGVAYKDPGCMIKADEPTPTIAPTPTNAPTVTNQPTLTTLAVNNRPPEDPVDGLSPEAEAAIATYREESHLRNLIFDLSSQGYQCKIDTSQHTMMISKGSFKTEIKLNDNLGSYLAAEDMADKTAQIFHFVQDNPYASAVSKTQGANGCNFSLVGFDIIHIYNGTWKYLNR